MNNVYTMPNPVQHLTTVSTPGIPGLNADYPQGEANYWTKTAVTDPSTNNQPLGRAIRNMEVTGGEIVPRIVRSGGSARPEFRVPGTPTPPGDCLCREYTGEISEIPSDFIICDYETFPLDFTARVGGGYQGDPLIAPGPDVPTLAEVNDLIGTFSDPPIPSGPDTPLTDSADLTCADLEGQAFAYYRFEDDLTDSSGNGQDMTGTGDAYTASGKINKGLSAGRGDSNTGVVGGTDFALACWLYDDGTVSGAGPFFEFRDSSDVSILKVSLRGNGAGVTTLRTVGSGTTDQAAATGWNHVAVSVTGGVASIFLNGEPAATPTVNTANGNALDKYAVAATDAHAGRADEAMVLASTMSYLMAHVLYHGGDGFDPTDV